MAERATSACDLCIRASCILRIIMLASPAYFRSAGAVVVAAVDAADHGDAAGADQLDDAERAASGR